MKEKEVIIIRNHAAISALGLSTSSAPLRANIDTCICKDEIEGMQAFVAKLNDSCNAAISELSDIPRYSKLDRSVLMAIYTGRLATQDISVGKNKKFLINVGSSRGATALFEKYHRHFLEKGNVPVLTSPTTTLGNISSWLAQDLDCYAECMSTSVTCSTALQAIGNSLAWLKSDMADFALAGASEAPLTAFTIAQMQALRIYADDMNLSYPCQPCAFESSAGCGMVLGEGAGVFLLEKINLEKALNEKHIILESFGFGRERIEHSTAMSDQGDCLYNAMSMALRPLGDNAEIDMIMMHAPGTQRGDACELEAIERVFGNKKPVLLSNKWMLGHTFGAAGALNLDAAISILKNQSYVDFPYQTIFRNIKIPKISRIMINAAGFGGNAASVIVSLNT